MSTPVSVSAPREGRKILAAVNESEILREAILYEFRRLGAGYCVGKRRPISDLTPEQQFRVREAYRDTGWASDYCVEICGFFTSLSLAEETCQQRNALYPTENYFYTKIPIDSCLPDEPVFGTWAHQFPGSDAQEMYENMESATLAVPVTQMRAMEEHAHTLENHLQSLKDEISRLQKLVTFIRGIQHRP